MSHAGCVHVVLAIDTEGPAATSGRADILPTWDGVDRFLAKVFAPAYRLAVPDSAGQGLVFSWFMLNWTGFRTNPVGRDLGYHKVYDHYHRQWGTAMRTYGDGVYLHYHHPAASGVGNEWGLSWEASQEYEQVQNRCLAERSWYPTIFRAGGTRECNQTSAWLEQWFPLDYSNRAGHLPWDALDSSGLPLRALCDWSQAPDDWSWYHPNAANYQRPGGMQRVIFRCADLCTGNYGLQEADIVQAFARAADGHQVVLATFDHDYRDRADLFAERLLQPLARVAQQYPQVPWRYANALDAAQAALGGHRTAGPAFTLQHQRGGATCQLTAASAVFGGGPLVVAQVPGVDVPQRLATRTTAQLTWSFPLPPAPATITIGGSDAWGNATVLRALWDGQAVTTAPA